MFWKESLMLSANSVAVLVSFAISLIFNERSTSHYEDNEKVCPIGTHPQISPPFCDCLSINATFPRTLALVLVPRMSDPPLHNQMLWRERISPPLDNSWPCESRFGSALALVVVVRVILPPNLHKLRRRTLRSAHARTLLTTILFIPSTLLSHFSHRVSPLTSKK